MGKNAGITEDGEKKGPGHSFDFTEAQTAVARSSLLVLVPCFTAGETEAHGDNLTRGRGAGKAPTLRLESR